MAISYKDGKVMTIIKEFVKVVDQTSYEINGVDISKAVFFAKEPLLTYVVIPVGDYTVTGTTENQQLVITNAELLEKTESFQVCYQEVNSSSPYDPPIQSTDPEILKDAYNVLQKNFTELWEYVREVCLITDISDLSNIMPELQENEIWVKTLTGWRGMDVRAFEFEVEGFWEAFDTKTKEALSYLDIYEKTKEEEIDIYIEGGAKPEVKAYGESEVNTFMETVAKPQIKNYGEVEVNSYINDIINPNLSVYGKAQVDSYMTTTAKPDLKIYGETEVNTYMTTTAKPDLKTYGLNEVKVYVDNTSKPELINCWEDLTSSFSQGFYGIKVLTQTEYDALGEVTATDGILYLIKG